jgi:HAD superfamily hydrolase (TIGR01509 family)
MEQSSGSGRWCPSPPRAVLFDFGGTLDGPGVPWKERMRRLYRDEGIDVTADRFDPVFYRADDALVGTIPTTLSLEDTVRRLVDDIDAALGSAPAGVRAAKRFVDDVVAAADAHAPVLAELASRYRLGIVSNFYGNLQRVCADVGLGRFFDVVVDSARVGVSKPDARIFRHALDALDVAPDAAVFVGDSLPRDMAGARALGMPHAWVVEPGTPAGSSCCPHDPVVRSLETLPGLLR